jgi:Tfp pilus assembly protein PilV
MIIKFPKKQSEQSWQAPHRASRYFLCLARNIKKYKLTMFDKLASFELKILKKARIRVTAADPPAKAHDVFYKKIFLSLSKAKILNILRIGKWRAGLDSGQIMVETMVALAMVVIGLLGFLSLLSYSIGLNKVVADQYVATYLASEGIEIIKNIEDTNVVNQVEYNTNLVGTNPSYYEVSSQPPNVQITSVSADISSLHPLKFDSTTKLYSYTGDVATPYTRQIKITYPTSDEMVVQSIVRWTTRGGIQSIVTLEDHFYNWRQ